MRVYVFTYFCKLPGDDYLQTHEFEVRANRFSQAFRSFADYFNGLPGIRDFSNNYRVSSSSRCDYRIFARSCFDQLVRVLPD